MRTRLFGLFARTQRPAPERQTRWTPARGTPLTLRPVRPDDAALLGDLFELGLSRAARYSRFHGAVGRLSAERLAWMANADFSQHAAFIVTRWEDGLEQAVAEGRWVRTAMSPSAEFALSVADAWQGCGIGQRLLAALVQAGREQDLRCLTGDVLQSNQAMQALARAQGFECGAHPNEPELMSAEMRLSPQPRRPAKTLGLFGGLNVFTAAAWQL